MRRFTIFALTLWVMMCPAVLAQVATTQPARPAVVDGEITVYFSPQGTHPRWHGHSAPLTALQGRKGRSETMVEGAG